jgi:hypothetical protein
MGGSMVVVCGTSIRYVKPGWHIIPEVALLLISW